MGLQVKVRHALGERVLELPDRSIEDPLTVGRATGAEVQVPSVSVSPRHCVLFIHEGHWAVQDLGAGSGTFVNGQPVEGARFLQVGDVISIGGLSGAPTILVDPIAAEEGRTGFAGTGLAQMSAPAGGGYGAYADTPPFAPGSPYVGTQAYGSAPVTGNAYGNAGYSAPAMRAGPIAPPQPVAYLPQQASAPTDEIAFQPDVSTSQVFTRRRQNSNTGAIAAVLITAILVGGLVTWVVVTKPNGPQVVEIKTETKTESKKVEPTKSTTPSEPNTPPKPAIVSPIKPRPSQSGGTAKPAVNPQIAKGGPTLGNSILPSDDSTGSSGTSSVPAVAPTPGVIRPGEKPEDSGPKKPAGGEMSEGMDPPVKKPGMGIGPKGNTGGDMMDPATPSKSPAAGAGKTDDPMMDPAGKPSKPTTGPAAQLPGDPETMDSATANSWPAMLALSKRPGKESFAVMRFDDYRRTHTGTHDAELDNFIDQKLDRIYWERVDQILKRLQSIEEEIAKAKGDLFDVTNPDAKKKLLDSLKKMDAERAAINKELRERMKYTSSEAPPLASESGLAELAAKRDKVYYESWKKATLNYIKANNGKLAWAGEP